MLWGDLVQQQDKIGFDKCRRVCISGGHDGCAQIMIAYETDSSVVLSYLMNDKVSTVSV